MRKVVGPGGTACANLPLSKTQQINFLALLVEFFWPLHHFYVGHTNNDLVTCTRWTGTCKIPLTISGLHNKFLLHVL